MGMISYQQRQLLAQQCTLPGGCDFPGKSCERCGWTKTEAERRKRLPLWRNDKGQWQKHIGHAEGK